MKGIIKQFFIFGFLFLIACNSGVKKKNSEISVHHQALDSLLIVEKDSLVLKGSEGNWYYKNNLFNGFAVQYYSNGKIKDKTGFLNGKKQGVYQLWFENGVLKLQSNFHQNSLEGTYKAWWNNGNLAASSQYKNGKMEGVYRKWYANGSLAKKSNLLNGKENGLQKAWLENGKLYVNYEAKNGRIFGMRRANSCYTLKNEKLFVKN